MPGHSVYSSTVDSCALSHVFPPVPFRGLLDPIILPLGPVRAGAKTNDGISQVIPGTSKTKKCRINRFCPHPIICVSDNEHGHAAHRPQEDHGDPRQDREDKVVIQATFFGLKTVQKWPEFIIRKSTVVHIASALPVQTG